MMDADLVKEFVWSTKEDCETLEDLLLKAENNTSGDDDINAIYRVFHSVKGAAGLVQLPQLEKAAHAGEDLLDAFRKSKEPLGKPTVSVLLGFLDGVKLVLDHLTADGNEGDGLFETFLSALNSLQNGASEQSAEVPVQVREESIQEDPTNTIRRGSSARRRAVAILENAVSSSVNSSVGGSAHGNGSHIKKTPVAQTESAQAESVPTTSPVPSAPVPPSAPSPRSTVPSTASPTPSKEVKEVVAETAIRVDVALLDRLMNLVGELVLTRNQLLNVVGEESTGALMAASQSLNQVTSELQENIMRTRMQPIGNIFNKFPRIVRDLSNQLNKKVELDISGKDTELDRTLLEALRDPFTHILRNCIDHGLETPEERLGDGKSESGTVAIKAFHEGGQVIVEVSDDGHGINAAKIKEKAISVGLITAEQAQMMSDQEAIMLVCKPGFSTAESITNVSGRGVGMDVVRSNIERIGGGLEILSQLGRGTTIRIKVPLTLAIIPALIVGAGGEMFGIPQINLVELVGVESTDLKSKIEVIRGAEVYRLREKLLTIVRLQQLFNLPQRENNDEMVFIVVVAAGDQQFGLVVEDIYDTEEIVVKPLSKHLSSIEHFAGATIRGDGRAALILDMPGIARAINIDMNAEKDSVQRHVDDSIDTHDFLVFHLGNNEQMAIPLELVARIEQYPASSLTHVNGSHVICHDDKLIPVVSLPDHTHFESMDLNADDEDEMIYAIIINTRGGIGILAKELVDSMPIDLSKSLSNKEFTGGPSVTSLVVVNQVPTALIDVYKILEDAYPQERLTDEECVVQQSDIPTPNTGDSPVGKILFCDDAQFFRNTVGSYLRGAGHQVDIFEDGKQAMEQFEKTPDAYNLILTDLEMPVMDGWEFIKYVRSMPQYDSLPMLALTSLDDEEARQRTLQCGADGHVVKLNKDELLSLVHRVLTEHPVHK